MNFRIVENAPDNFEDKYLMFKELLNITTLTACEILRKLDVNCNNNAMYRKLSKTYADEMGFNLRYRRSLIQKGVWL